MKRKINKSLKILFAGTTKFAQKHLKALIKSRHKISLVITKQNKFYKKNIYSSPVEKTSIKNSIPTISPKNIENKKIIKIIKKYLPDIMIVVAYGKKIPKKIINMFPLKAINIHPSLLPKWKGAAPIQRAILNGDKKTGISTILINNKFDSGDIINKIDCKISKKDTFFSLSKKLEKIGIKSMFLSLINIFKKNKIKKQKQEIKNTYAKKIDKLETRLIWKKSVNFLERSIRAFYPIPGNYFYFKKKRIKVFKSSISLKFKKYLFGEILKVSKNGVYIGAKNGCLIIKKIQFPGKKIINSIEIYNGYKNFFNVGEVIK
ncbi:methionyl-tRNA formyltransferase [Buchnera aphidicola (Ceratoglyphina bambusae)]|uniref:methionyl-tRNA formyltransferase n=1 Tax=Buchnera aphidicola TaxID=9 RepID=UPI0031B86636